MSLKERLAQKKQEKETPKKKTEKKEEKKKGTGTGRGRPVGVKYVLKEKVSKDLETRFAKLQEPYESFTEALEAFIEKGNKSQAKKAREFLQDISKQIKDFRKVIQEAKVNGLVQEPK